MLYKNKYRIESARLKDFDYSSAGWYYVTICTKEMKYWFGNVKNERIVLSQAGEIVLEEWNRTTAIRKNVELDEFIILPNHVHGIIIINSPNPHVNQPVETMGSSSLQQTQPITQNLSNIIKGIKSVTTFRIRNEIDKSFSWQPRFYDHIIRSEKALYKIRNYIRYNYLKWEEDENFSEV